MHPIPLDRGIPRQVPQTGIRYSTYNVYKSCPQQLHTCRGSSPRSKLGFSMAEFAYGLDHKRHTIRMGWGHSRSIAYQ
jgi:hypothetical protein